MLNRRSFFKTVMAVGAGLLLPSGRSNETLAYSAACGSSQSPGSAPAIAEKVTHHNLDINSLFELERCADLLDDLDCTEIVTKNVGLTEFSRCAGDTSFWRAHCPFCTQRNLHSLEVGPEYFNCDWCDATGSAIDCYARIEGLSHTEASVRLEGLLNDGTLAGRRPEYEHAWEVMARAQSFYHHLLNESPAGADARSILADQGIGVVTIKHFMLGYAPAEPADLLSRHLVDAGYDSECLHLVCLKAEDGSRMMVDRYGRGNLLIPIRDSSGRSWGFFQKRIFPGNNNFEVGWSQSLLPVSERRLRRLIFPHPSWPRDFHRYETVLLAKTPWEVIALRNAGIENVVCMLEGQ